MRRLAPILIVLALPLVLPAAAPAAPEMEGSLNMKFVKNLPYQARNGDIPNYGTDIEFATIAGRKYALAGSYRNGLQIVDITNPALATIKAVYDCGVTQGDVQVIRQADLPGRTYVAYTSDTYGDGTSKCYRDAKALGFDVLKPNGTGKNGTFIAEITNPLAPKTISFIEVPQGSHNQTVHPSGNYLYNSNSDLATSLQPAIEIFDINKLSAPRKVGELSLPVNPGLGSESHDITFNKSGSRAYSAALSQGVIIDTTRPAAPKIVKTFTDPAINVWHQSDPFSTTDASGRRRDFLIVEDEFVGAVGTGQCPNGGVHVYEITGAKEKSPEKVGYWNIDTVDTTDQVDGRCTAHVFDIHERQKLMTIAFYNGGVRVVDLSGLAGVSLADQQVQGQGMKEVGAFRIKGGEAWSAKTNEIYTNGNFYLYGNDIERGLDVYHYTARATPSANPGTWMGPAEAAAFLERQQTVPVTRENALVCLLPQ
jgi:hypothetical protein